CQCRVTWNILIHSCARENYDPKATRKGRRWVDVRLFPALLSDDGKGKSHAGNAFSRGVFVKSSSGNRFYRGGFAKSSAGNRFSDAGFPQSRVGNRSFRAGIVKPGGGGRFYRGGFVKSSGGDRFPARIYQIQYWKSLLLRRMCEI